LSRTGGATLDAGTLQNVGGKGVGSSQITSVVERRSRSVTSSPYNVSAQTRLAPPHFAVLAAPRLLSQAERRLLAEVGEEARTADDWWNVVKKIRRHD